MANKTLAPQQARSRESMRKLLKAAAEASGCAYCPYSNFRVGAAALAGNAVFSVSSFMDALPAEEAVPA